MSSRLPLSALVELLVDDYGDQFRSRDEAQRFARDMVARYCERIWPASASGSQRGTVGVSATSVDPLIW